jgi:5'-nucleotidase
LRQIGQRAKVNLGRHTRPFARSPTKESPAVRAGTRSFTGGLAALAVALTGSVVTAASASAGVSTTAPVIIDEVYGGGGSSSTSTAYKRDFIELYNPGSEAVSIAGWSVQYGSSTGTAYQVTPLTG